MRLIASLDEIRSLTQDLRRRGRPVCLVPTMGALHAGHLSLVRRAKSDGGALVVSIFVNPAQFGPAEDYSRYPRDLDRDREALAAFEPEAVFVPEAPAMYPGRFETYVEPGSVAERFEGALRPGHFRGVTTVVLKLLNLIAPDVAYFGQKDFQQTAVLRRVITDFNINTGLVICPTVREPDGLALSSRNAYLSAGDRRAAPVLYRSLCRARELFHGGETRADLLESAMRGVLEGEPGAKVDYAVIVRPETLEPVIRVTPGCVALVAARVGPVRLIDNLILGPRGASDENLIDLASPSS
ncbi:MAG TPA: pantoate--beta-alanine ligase [Terriglobia bacterium]|nr:pantoate--beta-alanine ligase [Terriglobia bacterium]